MTGYGRSVETRSGREFTVEVRSVNNRYLDCSVRLPRLVAFGEDAVKQAVKAVISRGKVDVYVSVRSEGGEQGTVTLNTALAEGYLAAMRQMAETFGLENDVKVSDLSRLPNGEISVDVHTYAGMAQGKKFRELPLIRGVFNFVDSMILGTKALDFSASFYDTL